MKKSLMVLGLIFFILIFPQNIGASSPVMSPTCDVTGVITAKEVTILDGASYNRQDNVTHLYINMSIENASFLYGSTETGTCESFFPIGSEKSFFISDPRIYDDNNVSVINLFVIGRRLISVVSTGSVGAFTVWNYSFINSSNVNSTCAQDILMCADGSVLQRDPTRNCTFAACPTSDCKAEGDMCGGIAGFTCCDGFECALEGDYPDAAGTCVVAQEATCHDLCGDGVCQDVVCEGTDCPCVESFELCAADCRMIEEQGSGSSFLFRWPLLFIIGAVVFIFIGLKILKWIFWTLAFLAIIVALWFWFF